MEKNKKLVRIRKIAPVEDAKFARANGTHNDVSKPTVSFKEIQT